MIALDGVSDNRSNQYLFVGQHPRLYCSDYSTIRSNSMTWSVWLEWVSTHRVSSTPSNSLLDAYVDPKTEQHMNLGSVNAAYLGVGAETEAVKMNHRAATDSKRSRSPTVPSRTDRFRINENLWPLEASSPQTKRSRQQSNGHSRTDNSKGTWRNGIASYPNAKDVEQALSGCGVSQVLLPWLDSIDVHTSKETALPSNHHSDSESYTSGVAAMELAMEACRISNPSRSDANPPAVSIAPISSTTLEPVQVADPPEMLRLTTSTIIGQQSLIWNQIQLERQQHHLGVAPVATISPSPRAVAGSLAAATTRTASHNVQTIGPNRVTMGHSSQSALVPQSHRSTTRFGARDRSVIEPVSSDASCSRTARPVPSTMVNSTYQNPHSLVRTLRASAPPPRPGAEQHQDAMPRRYRYTPSPIPRDPTVFFQSRQRRGVVDEQSSLAQPASRIRSTTSAIQTASLSAHNGISTSTATSAATVPCLECQAPLHIPTTRNAPMLAAALPPVVQCPSCGTMASLELILSLVGTE
jgi:hypothetical protein